MCNTPNLQQGNDYKIKCPYNLQNADGSITPIAVTTMTDVEVKVLRGSVSVKESVTYTSADNYFLVDIPATYASGQYAIIISGKIAGRAVRDARKYAFTLVEWAEHSDMQDYVQGTEITLEDGVFVFAADTEGVAELEDQLREKIAEVEEEKAEWQRKVAELEDVAKETKATENKEEIIRKIETTQPDLSAIAKESTLNAQSAEIKTAIAKGGGNPSKMAYEAMKRREEYLYEIEYSELDYEAARAFFKTHFAPINGACTALRKGNIIGRNYDWTYSKEVSFLVRTKAHNGRYASIGLAGSIAALTTDTIGEYSEEFRYMPFRLLDGLNEKGVYANVNMLNNAEGRTLPTTGTVPLIEERERICSAMLVRYILDNFATPQEACEYIRNYVAVYPPYHDGATTDLHFSLSSKEQLYYLCFEQEGGVWRTMYVDVKDQPLPFVMTNFRMWWAQYIFDQQTGHYNRFADPTYQYVEKYAMGIERANLCLDFVRDTQTEQSVLDFMTNDLAYTRSYMELTDPLWLTEFVGQYSEEDLARDSAAEDFERILGIVRQRYAERSRETALTWQTVHSVTYDLENLTMQLVVQEGDAEDAITIDCFKSLPATKEDVQNIDLSNVAKEDTLNEQAQAIKDKIDNIDLSELAKQGDNPAATNSAILEAMPTVVTPPVTDAEFAEFEQHMSNDIYI